ncbi:rRNA biogenesis protein rrp36-like [Forsythia ovata]|uniref:rRNA biogenesis protein rrp36-like n=1 Tax=Forsythia ovata TaxID=205694 RepID=A0ABD1WCZ3_9LAMI
MESLIKQTRAKFTGAGKENKESSSAKDRKIPPQKTQSFREKKRSESWIRRQFSRQTNVDRDFGGDEYPAAVAAAALAIQLLEESRTGDQKKTTHGHDTSLAKMKSKAEDKGNLPEPRKGSVKFSDETSKTSLKDTDIKVAISTSASKKMTEKEVGPAPSIKKKPTFAYTDPNNIIIDKIPEKASPEKAAEPVTSMGRPPTSADKQLNITGSETPETTARIPDRPPTMQSTNLPVETKKQIPTKPGPGDTKADAWEKAEMARIKERYEKLSTTIQNWETKRKKKSKRRLESIEAELDKKRAISLQKNHREMKRIEEISQGAITQAKKNRRNEELKVTEKASKFRSTGKLPATCLCF